VAGRAEPCVGTVDRGAVALTRSLPAGHDRDSVTVRDATAAWVGVLSPVPVA
jgi:hypothetical protein